MISIRKCICSQNRLAFRLRISAKIRVQSQARNLIQSFETEYRHGAVLHCNPRVADSGNVACGSQSDLSYTDNRIL